MEEAIIRKRTNIVPQRKRDGLIQHAKNYTSQNGEDGIIEKIFELIPQKEYHCIDVGAWDGKHLSNTFTLLSKNNWKGILIEADYDKFKDLQMLYGKNANAICLNVEVSCLQKSKQSLLNIVNEVQRNNLIWNGSIDIDFLCIDVDG